MTKERESPLKIIKEAYAENFKLSSDDALVIDGFISALTASFHKGLSESVWIYIVGPPGSGKTEMVTPMKGHRKCIMLTSPSENALMSGYRDDESKEKDPSLATDLNGKVLIIKDFTAIMEASRNVVNKVLGELRDMYDHYSSKASGRVGLVEYEAKFGVVACVTDMIDEFAEEHQQLGQRFLSLRINRVPMSYHQRVDYLLRVIGAMHEKEKWKAALQKKVHEQISRIVEVCEKGIVPSISKETQTDLSALADFLALARTVPGTESAIRPELATRIVQQIINFGLAHAIADGRNGWNEDDTALVERVVSDSLSLPRKRLLAYLFGLGPHRPAAPFNQLCKKCNITPPEIKRMLMQYVFSGIVETTRATGGGGEDDDEPWYRLSHEIYQLIYNHNVFGILVNGKD